MTGHTERFASIDVLKAVAILTVVGIHAVSFRPLGRVELYAFELARFAVPVFLAVSGWLYAERGRVPVTRTLLRLRRVLLPYLVASMLAQLYWWWRGLPRSWIGIGSDLLLGASFSPYYYVFAVTTMVLLTPLVARVPQRGLLAAWIVLVGVRGAAIAIAVTRPDLAVGDMFWAVRDPTHWGVYFLAGWVCALYRERLLVFGRRHRRMLLSLSVGVAGALSVVAMRVEEPVISALAGWVNTLVVSAVVALASSSVAKSPPAVRFLSDASYAFYLYHLFFVFEAHRALAPSLLSEPVAWTAGVVGPWLFVLASRRVLGARARTWIGA